MIPRSLIIAGLLVPALGAEPETRREQGIGPEMLPAGPLAPSADLPDDEELAARRAAAGDLSPKAQPLRKRGFGLAEFSLFLSFGDASTLLPKGSMIHCPDALAARVLAKPAGTLLPWPDFLLANRNWITTREVSPAQVRGEVPVSGEDRAAFANGGKIVIATLRGNPVTVLARSPEAPAKP